MLLLFTWWEERLKSVFSYWLWHKQPGNNRKPETLQHSVMKQKSDFQRKTKRGVEERNNKYLSVSQALNAEIKQIVSCSRLLTSLLISSCLSGAERAVALIMVDVWLSVSFLMQRWPATMLQTYREEEKNIPLMKPLYQSDGPLKDSPSVADGDGKKGLFVSSQTTKYGDISSIRRAWFSPPGEGKCASVLGLLAGRGDVDTWAADCTSA